MESTEPPKKRGPKQQYKREKSYQAGAPLLTTRVKPEVLEWVQSRPEGTRPYIERLVEDDRDRTQGALPLSGKAEQAAEA